MISFHPKYIDLQAFSAGNCEPAMALMISAHVDMCAQCQQDCIEIQADLAGELFAEQTIIKPLDSDYLEMMSNITQLPISKSPVAQASNASIELDGKFLEQADAVGLKALKGHRVVGGMRASIYNAMPIEGVQALVDFMREFEQENA